MLAPSPTTLLAQPLLATRPRLLRPIEPRLAARLDATVAIPQPQSSRDSRLGAWTAAAGRRPHLLRPEGAPKRAVWEGEGGKGVTRPI